VIFDTGIADFILPSASCDSSCQGHNLYNASESSTSLDTKKKFSTQLDGNMVSGEVYTDSVTLTGYTVGSHGFGRSQG
jgi:Eukaryotic aspartyl protease